MPKHTHTPGPWKPSNVTLDRKEWASVLGKNSVDVVLKGGNIVAAVWCAEDRDGEEAANARLISAAPELLQALVAWVESTSRANETGSMRPVYDLAVAAIAKARGT